MKRSVYPEQDYAFGQRILTLRTAIGLTQAGLASILGVSRQSVVDWESGRKYPKVERLRAFIVLAMQYHVFTVGREADQIRELWRSARQKVLLDEAWLLALIAAHSDGNISHIFSPRNGTLSTNAVMALADAIPSAGLFSQSVDETSSVAPSVNRPRVDWGDAIDVPVFYGRESDLVQLSQWVVEERCRVVSILGMGGIGKSALAVTLMKRVAAHFEVVIWRSLRDIPSCETLVEECLKVLAPQVLRDIAQSLEARLRLLMDSLRNQRVLLVLDNLEMLLEEGMGTGRMRAGAEGYGRLLRQIGEIGHQSCLLFTSREKPADIVPLEGRQAPVRALRLAGLDGYAGAQLLAERDLTGSSYDQARLVGTYQGNPLALKIAAQTIEDLFGGEIAPFLDQGGVIFGEVRELLREQFDRLSALEQNVCYWLAILRELMSLTDLLAVISAPRVSTQMLEALDGLGRRNLIERGQQAGTFTLQSVVLEYVTARLLGEVTEEIEQGRLARLIEYGLHQAQAKDYVREIQEHLLVIPVLSQLQSTYRWQADLESRLFQLLDDLRGLPQKSQGYGPANLVTLLRFLRRDLRGLNFERLALRGVFLQGVEMQGASLSGAAMEDCVFTESFDAVTAVAISKSGKYWAAGNRRGDVWIWEDAGRTLRTVWQAHSASVYTLAFSPDELTLVSGSFDCSVKLWNITNGDLLWTAWHQGGLVCSAFAPDGEFIATGANDAVIHVWDSHSGANVSKIASQGGTVYSVAWSPDGEVLIGGCYDGNIRIWEPKKAQPEIRTRILIGHTHWVTGLAFAPDGKRFASGSIDGTIRLWDTDGLNEVQIFSEQMDQVMRVAWSSDGHTLASADIGKMVWLWDITSRKVRAYLHGHSAAILSIAFTPDSSALVSGSNDGTMRVWDVERGQPLRVMGGYTAFLHDIDWSPDGTQVAGGGANASVAIWNMDDPISPIVLRGHDWTIEGVSWSPDGRLLASGGYDSIRLWSTVTGKVVNVLRDSGADSTIFLGVAWSPDGRLLACGSYLLGVQLWEMTTHTYRWLGGTSPTHIRHVAWSSDGTRLAGAGDDGYVYVWDVTTSIQLLRLAGHNGAVRSIAWNPDGVRLASAAGSRDSGGIFVWNTANGERVQAITGHPETIFALAWDPNGEMIISGSSDGRLRWWEIAGGQCVRVREAHLGTVQALKLNADGSRFASSGDDGAIVVWDLRSGAQIQTLRQERPYERLNITGIRGLTEVEKAMLRALGAIETN